MIVIRCSACPAEVRVAPGMEGELEALFNSSDGMWPDRYACGDCGAQAAVAEVADPERPITRDLTPVEAVAYFAGLGAPEEQECSPAAVRACFAASPVLNVSVRSIRNSHRSVLDVIELIDGTRIFLGSAPEGAVVYRIAKRATYADKI